MFIDIALKSVGIQFVYAIVVLAVTALVHKVISSKKGEKKQNE